MTIRTPKLTLLVAAAAGFCLLAASAANAGTSIAPFSLQLKSKIYTFNYPTGAGATFSCAACYAPGAYFSSSGTTGGAAYFYGPLFTAPRTPGNHATPTSGYYFNPYWGALAGIISSYGAGVDTSHTGNAATITSGSRPDFHVEPSQPHLVGITGDHTFGPGGNYLGTTSMFLATNSDFDLGSGDGPGTTVFLGEGNKGGVTFTQGTDHASGFGGTLRWLGGSIGSYLIKTTQGGGGNCNGTATSCYYYVPFQFPVNAGPAAGQNTWTDVVTYSFVNVFNGGAQKTSTPSGLIKTRYTTHSATTGGVRMTQPFPSV